MAALSVRITVHLVTIDAQTSSHNCRFPTLPPNRQRKQDKGGQQSQSNDEHNGNEHHSYAQNV
jgi:hypothetical protein